MIFTSTIEINAKGRLLKTYYEALIPESIEKGRSTYKLDLKKDKLIIQITSQDATALKAITNTITNIISLIEKTWRMKNE